MASAITPTMAETRMTRVSAHEPGAHRCSVRDQHIDCGVWWRDDGFQPAAMVAASHRAAALVRHLACGAEMTMAGISHLRRTGESRKQWRQRRAREAGAAGAPDARGRQQTAYRLTRLARASRRSPRSVSSSMRSGNICSDGSRGQAWCETVGAGAAMAAAAGWQDVRHDFCASRRSTR